MYNNLLLFMSRVDSIFYSDIDWKYKYDMIFQIGKDHIYSELDSLGIRLDYYDPDTTYEEDVTAFVNALHNIRDRLGKDFFGRRVRCY
jgi:hypothetical protein